MQDLEAHFKAKGKAVTKETIEEFAWETLNSGKVGWPHCCVGRSPGKRGWGGGGVSSIRCAVHVATFVDVRVEVLAINVRAKLTKQRTRGSNLCVVGVFLSRYACLRMT